MTVSGRALDFVKGIDVTYPKILTVFFTVAVVYPGLSLGILFFTKQKQKGS